MQLGRNASIVPVNPEPVASIMLKKLRTLFGIAPQKPSDVAPFILIDQSPPKEIAIDGHEAFPIASHLTMHHGLPVMDWIPVQSWVDGIASEELQAKAWSATEQAWLLHFREALGPKYRLMQSESAALLSPLDNNVARATLEYMNRTLKRVTTVLEGVAEVAPWGLDLLIVFEDNERYYDYVSHYYPDDGEFAFSGGMFIDAGCGHFVTVQADLRSIEPVIAHEMTHACLSHLPLPLWLNEGLAVNTEQRLSGRPASIYTPQQMRAKHLSFWGEREIQEFWSGESFARTDDGNLLSYDLARIIVEQIAKDWDQFRKFALTADWHDAGAAAAREYLDISLGEIISSLLEKPDSLVWEPSVQPAESDRSAAIHPPVFSAHVINPPKGV